MTIVETVLVASSVINVILLVLVFVLYINFLSVKLHVNQIFNGVATVLNKLVHLEQVTGKMAAGFTEFIKMTEDMVDRMDDGRAGQVYRTTDGKYSAKSLDELINKIKDDGSETDYFSDDEMKNLRSLFEEDEEDLDNEDDLH